MGREERDADTLSGALPSLHLHKNIADLGGPYGISGNERIVSRQASNQRDFCAAQIVPK
jgi:hypothetical protein